MNGRLVIGQWQSDPPTGVDWLLETTSSTPGILWTTRTASLRSKQSLFRTRVLSASEGSASSSTCRPAPGRSRRARFSRRRFRLAIAVRPRAAPCAPAGVNTLTEAMHPYRDDSRREESRFHSLLEEASKANSRASVLRNPASELMRGDSFPRPPATGPALSGYCPYSRTLRENRA